jgi:hypothetical protein
LFSIDVEEEKEKDVALLGFVFSLFFKGAKKDQRTAGFFPASSHCGVRAEGSPDILFE